MTADTNSPLLGLLLMGTGNDNNAWGDNLNNNVILLIEQALVGRTDVTGMTGGAVTLTTDQMRSRLVTIQGTLTSDLTLTLPATTRMTKFINICSGNFAVLLTAGGSPINLPFNKFIDIHVFNGAVARTDQQEVGSLFYHAGTTVPGGAKECDGTALKRASFPSLFTAIGTTYGNNDATDFKLPLATDTGRYLRSRSGSLTIGTAQSNQNKSHTHTGSGTTSGQSATHTHTGSGTTSGVSAFHTHTGSGTTSGVSVDHSHTGSGTTSSSGADHTHTGSGNTGGISANHTHTGTTDGPSVSLAHSHTYSGTTSGQSATHTHTSLKPSFPGGASLASGSGFQATQAADTTGNASVDHTHTYSGTTATDSGTLSHTHTFTTGIQSADHSHAYSFTTSASSAYLHTHTYSFTTSGISADHTHTYSFTTSGDSVDHSHTYSFTTAAGSVDHTHTYSFTTSTGSADGTEARPESLVGMLCIRY